ncbi:MAG: ATP-grasp domain-containing protein, partial [Myxococcota bacterium]
VAIERELSVIVARSRSGKLAVFPPVAMDFVPTANLLDKLVAPAPVAEHVAARAVELARGLTAELGLVGLLAVEMFLDRRGEILVNELAPRPHNSGHHTIEASETSQYEQHLRALLDLPLGPTSTRPAVMVNLLGAAGYEGAPVVEGEARWRDDEEVTLHLYGKKQTRPFRKMGHATVVSASLEAAMAKADEVKRTVIIRS